MTQIRELAEGEIHLGYPAMVQLRTSVGSVPEFVERVTDQRGAGYRLLGVFEDDDDALAVCGFRLGQNLAWGRHLYIDDLSTVPAARGRGFGGALLEWVHGEARRLGCGQVHLDSGVQPERASAHRLYFGQRYRISSYHFARTITPGQD